MHIVHRCGLWRSMLYVAWSVCVSLCVCLSVTFLNSAKTAGRIVMPFGREVGLAQSHIVLGGVWGPRSPTERGHAGRKVIFGLSPRTAAAGPPMCSGETTEPIGMISVSFCRARRTLPNALNQGKSGPA